jgi:hypothetical protein
MFSLRCEYRLSSRFLSRVEYWLCANVLEERTASIIRAVGEVYCHTAKAQHGAAAQRSLT